MTDNHPITPPPELVEQWSLSAWAMPLDEWVTDVATQAARWGSDQELEACCDWMSNRSSLTEQLRAARRPKPPSLKEQALAVLDDVRAIDATHYNILRNALEALPD